MGQVLSDVPRAVLEARVFIDAYRRGSSDAGVAFEAVEGCRAVYGIDVTGQALTLLERF